MYVRSVSVENFRHFEKAAVKFYDPGSDAPIHKDALRNVTLLVGVNGAGKTSVLRAIALSVLAKVMPMSGFKPEYLVRRGSKRIAKARIVGELRLSSVDYSSGGADSEWRHTVLVERKGDYESITNEEPEKIRDLVQPWLKRHEPDPLFTDYSPAYFLLGYGGTRRTEDPKLSSAALSPSRSPRFQRVAGLFEEQVVLVPLSAWLPTVDNSSPRYQEIVSLLNGLLPEDVSFEGKIGDGDAMFDFKGIEIPFKELSSGFRSFVGLVADILYHLHKCIPKGKLAKSAGTVMVDDIDLHLHPEWQRIVVPCLSKAFPKLQFILTSHSPLVAGTLHSDNVRIIEDGKIRQSEERLHGLSADQILTSVYFGNTPPRSEAAQARLKELARETGDTGDPSRAIEYLKTLAGRDKAHSNGKHRHS